MQQELQTAMEQVPGWDKEHREKIRDLNKQVSTFAVGHLIANSAAGLSPIARTVHRVISIELEADVVENAFDFIRTAMAQEAGRGCCRWQQCRGSSETIRAGDDAAAYPALQG